MKRRIIWIDIAKFMSIFCIYIGHFEENVGFMHKFVFAFHVP